MDAEKQMRTIIIDTLWMARRYANGRSTYAAPTVNRCIQLATELGIEIHDDPTLIEDGNSNAKFLDIH